MIAAGFPETSTYNNMTVIKQHLSQVSTRLWVIMQDVPRRLRRSASALQSPLHAIFAAGTAPRVRAVVVIAVGWGCNGLLRSLARLLLLLMLLGGLLLQQDTRSFICSTRRPCSGAKCRQVLEAGTASRSLRVPICIFTTFGMHVHANEQAGTCTGHASCTFLRFLLPLADASSGSRLRFFSFLCFLRLLLPA